MFPASKIPLRFNDLQKVPRQPVNAGELSGELEHCGNALGLGRFEARPAIGAEPFERAEARLVGHARRPFDPVAKIDVRKSGTRGALDMIGDDIGTEPLAQRVRRIEFVAELPKTISGKIRRVQLRKDETAKAQAVERGEHEYFEDDFPALKG